MEMIVKLQKDRHVLREKELLESMYGKHFNIINLLNTFKDTRNLYFVFEYGPKGTLDDLIKKCGGKLPEDVVKVIFAQLINFIEFLQKQNIMHRDLKPQNIMLDQNYNCKVIDFGDAKKVDEPPFEEIPE